MGLGPVSTATPPPPHDIPSPPRDLIHPQDTDDLLKTFPSLEKMVKIYSKDEISGCVILCPEFQLAEYLARTQRLDALQQLAEQEVEGAREKLAAFEREVIYLSACDIGKEK